MLNSIRPDPPETYLRELAIDDVAEAVALARHFHAESAYASYPLAIGKVVGLIEKATQSQDMLCVVLARRDTDLIVGYLLAIVHEHYFSYTLTCSDLGFYILPEYRNRGMGRALLRSVRAWAQERDADGISLQVAAANSIHKPNQFQHRHGN